MKTPFSEQFSERLSELVGRQNFSPNSRSVFFFKIGVVPANQGNHIYHRYLSSVAPISFGKDKFLTGARWCMASLSKGIFHSFRRALKINFSAAAFWVFREGVFQKMPALEGQFLKEISPEICRRKSPQNTGEHKIKLCSEVLNDPFPKTPFFSC